MRFLIVLRPMTNEPHLRDRAQKCVEPRKSKVSGVPSPSLARCSAAWRPKRISRVLSGCNASSNARSLSCRSCRKALAGSNVATATGLLRADGRLVYTAEDLRVRLVEAHHER